MLKSFLFLFVIASTSATADRTIVDLAVATPDLSTLTTALKAGNLVDTLSGAGPFTVFAPTNEAFAKLPKATLDRLLDPANVNELRNILTYHVAAGKVLSSQIKDGEKIKTVQGQDVKATLFAHRVFINKAEVVRADVKGSNGIVHIIDQVLIPPTAPKPPAPAPNTIVDLAVATPDLSTLTTALKAGNLVDTLSGAGPFTVFAPTNEAFAKLPKATLDRLLDPANVNELRNILTYHVAAGKVLSSQIKDGEKIKTVQGQDVKATLFAHRVFINKAEVVRADVKGSNGIVHIIDQVLIPPTAPKPTQCRQKRDYSCASGNTFCQVNLVRWCALGTVCDRSWTPAKGGTNPCINPPPALGNSTSII